MKNNSHQIPRTKVLALVTVTLITAGILLCDSAAQAQSSITGVYPNGTNMFQPSSTLSFTASSPAGVTNVTVQLTVTNLYTGQSFLRNLTASSGLTITGSSTSETVSAVLTSNTIYSAVIQIKDANGSVASQTVGFDTITPAYTWEAEDWDYTSNGVPNLFIDNPPTDAYTNLATTVEASNNNGPGVYRPSVPGLSTEVNGDLARLPWISTGFQDFDVGWTDGSEFGNYTRHYPPGTYNLFVRVAGGNDPQTESGDISVVSGTATINSAGSSPYKYGEKGRGWQSYDFMPVTDNAGNLIQITFDGSASTLQEIQVQANDNINFFMLMPLNTNVPVSTVTITNVSPDGSALFNPAGTFSFSATATNAIDPANVLVILTATNLWGQGSVSDLTSANGLTITGPSTNLNVSFPTTSNTLYTVFMQVIDGNGVPISSTVSFDTIIPTYTFEAEDFDWGSGQYIDNPQTNAYSGLDGTAEVDFHVDSQHGGDYGARLGLTTESLNEKLRPQYNGTGFQDYDVGFNDGGNWGNYTRNYPAGTYNIYVRASDGNGNGSADSGSMSLVTSGLGTSSQTLSQLGKWGVPPTGGWGSYVWVPVKDPAGNLAQFTGGSLETLRMTIDGGNCNENFFLLTPADPSVVLQPYVDSFQPDGSVLFQFTNQLSFIVHSQPGTATNNIVLNLNGANVSGLTFSGTPNIRNVSYPVQLNAYYTAIVTVTDAHGTVSTTNVFGTFNSTNYQWEAEDYDHDSGQFSDNPQVDAYNGLGSAPGVDNNQADLNGSPFLYRLNSPGPATTVAGDYARTQFSSGTDYNIGFFGHNSWANYTRHYPAGTYNVIGRFAEGN